MQYVDVSTYTYGLMIGVTQFHISVTLVKLQQVMWT